MFCVYSNLNIHFVVGLQDKAQPETQAQSFGSVTFNALLAVDDPGALPLVRQPGSDGFRMDSSALFQVSMKVKHMKPPVNTLKLSIFPNFTMCNALQKLFFEGIYGFVPPSL